MPFTTSDSSPLITDRPASDLEWGDGIILPASRRLLDSKSLEWLPNSFDAKATPARANPAIWAPVFSDTQITVQAPFTAQVDRDSELDDIDDLIALWTNDDELFASQDQDASSSLESNASIDSRSDSSASSSPSFAPPDSPWTMSDGSTYSPASSCSYSSTPSSVSSDLTWDIDMPSDALQDPFEAEYLSYSSSSSSADLPPIDLFFGLPFDTQPDLSALLELSPLSDPSSLPIFPFPPDTIDPSFLLDGCDDSLDASATNSPALDPGYFPVDSTVIGADIPRKRNSLEKRGVTKGVKKSRVGARYEPLSPVKLGGRNSPALKGSLLTFESSPSAELKPSRELSAPSQDDIPFSVTSRPLSAPLHDDVLSPSNLQPPDSSSAICSISPHDARQDIQTGVSLQSTPGSNFVPKRRRARNPSRDSATRKSRLSPLASAAPTTPPTAPRIMDTGMDRFDVGGGEVQAELTSPNLAEELELQKLFQDQRRSTRTKRSVTYEGWDDELEAPSPKRTKLTVPSSIKVTDRPRSKKAKSAVFHCSFPLCTATFTRQNDLVRHLRNSSAHSSTSDAQDDEDKRCAHCNRKLSRADARRRHEISGACGKRNTKNKPGHPAESYISFS